MKGGTPLDYVEFQLTPTRTRCELFVSAEGVTEKLASGFLKPFVTHLRAAEVQVARGSQVIRLEGHRNFSKQTDSTWFTKGTLERFVRFVSTPEVIERVKTIEDELSQLEQVRNALAKTFAQTEDRFPNMDTAFFPSGEYQEKDGMFIMPRRHSKDADDNAADATKRELLRAMDARLIALKQEQNLSFSRAAAAGFDSSNMAHLITFAKTFGADRLNDACLQFMALLRKRISSAGGYEETDSPSAEALSSGSDMSLESCNEIDLAAESEETSDLKSRNSGGWLNGQNRNDSDFMKNVEDWGVKMISTENLKLSMGNHSAWTRNNTSTRRRWGPPEKLKMDYPSSQTHSSQDSPESKMVRDDKSLRESGMVSLQVGEGFDATNQLDKNSPLPQQEQTGFPDLGWKLFPRHSPVDQRSKPISRGGMFFARLQQMAQKVEARRCEDLGGNTLEMFMGMDDLSSQDTALQASSPAPISSKSSHSSKLQASGDQDHDQSHIRGVENVPSSSPLSEMCLSLPAEVVQTGQSHFLCPSSVATQSVNHSLLQDGMVKEKDCLKKPEVNHVMEEEGNDAKGNQEKPVSTSARRLSVQDAISLFERKKTDTVEAPLKKMVKQGSHKGSMETSVPSTPEKAVLRRWSGTNLPSSQESCQQEKGTVLDSTEATINVEPNFAKNKDGANKDTSVGSKLIQNLHSQPVAKEPVTERCKTSHLQQPEQTGLSTPSEADSLSTKKRSLGTNSLNVCGEDLEKQFRIDLAKSLARVARNNAAKETVISSKSEGGSAKNASTELQNEDQSNVSSRETKQEAEMKWSDQTPRPFLPTMGTCNGPKMALVATQEHDNADGQAPRHFLPTLGTGPKMAPVATQEHDNAEQVTMTYLKQESVPVKMPEIVILKKTGDDAIQAVTRTGPGRFSGQRESNVSSRETKQEAETKWSGQIPKDFLPTLGTFNGPKVALIATQEDDNADGQTARDFLPTLGTCNEPKMAPVGTQEHDNAEQVTMTYLKQESVPVKMPEIVKLKKTADDAIQAVTRTDSGRFSGQREQNSRREASTNLWSIPLDFHMEALVKMVDNRYHDSLTLSHEESPHGERGRFYEYYDNLRDARRRREHPAKRAEREAKLKFILEIFEIRITEMEERALRPRKNNTHLAQVQLHVEKFHPQNADLLGAQMEQEELRGEEETDQEYNSSQMQHPSYEFSNPESPASTPCLSKNQASALKSRAVKKTVPVLSKSLTAPRTSLRTTASSSPRSTQKNISGSPSQRKLPSPSHNGTMDNSLIKSIPNSTEWRKETAKPSSARAVASAKVNLKVNGHSQTASDGSLLADNNFLANDDTYAGSADKEEMIRQLSLIRKNLTSASELKALSAQAFDSTVLESLQGQQELLTDSVVYGKARQSLVALTQEFKPFLRKGQGIGPGSGSLMKQELSVPVDASKSSDEDGVTDSILNEEMTYPYPEHEIVEPQDLTKSFVADNFEGSIVCENFVTSNVPVMDVSDGYGSPSVNKGQPVCFKVRALDYLREDAFNHDRVCHSTFSPDDLYEERHQGLLAGDPILVAHPEVPNCEQKGAILSANISELLAEKITDSPQSNASFVTSSIPFWEVALSHEHSASPFYPAATTSANLSVPQCGSVSGHFSPPSGMALESPSGSPASWNSTQTHFPSETDLVRSHRPLMGSPVSWNSTQTHFPSETDLVDSQRPLSDPQKAASIVSQPPKESAKGFKRLLHFGRKTRASETATTDGVSAATTSEGDDDAEEARDLGNQSSDDFLQRERIQERVFDIGKSADHHNFQDQGTIQMLRSSIPAPPINFKLREDHLSGSTLLKAPRSFFSLSSFRSRGGEGKSR